MPYVFIMTWHQWFEDTTRSLFALEQLWEVVVHICFFIGTFQPMESYGDHPVTAEYS